MATLQALLHDCIERRIGEHDMMRCKMCNQMAHNDIMGHPYGIQHTQHCSYAKFYKLLYLRVDLASEDGAFLCRMFEVLNSLVPDTIDDIDYPFERFANCPMARAALAARTASEVIR